MALPTAYTESSLRSYMLSAVGTLATSVGLTINSFTEAINDVLAAYGVTDIALATDVAKVRALAKVEALRVALATVALDFDFAADGGDYKRSQVTKNITDMLRVAEADAMQYGDSYAIQVGTLNYVNDPYPFAVEDEAAL